MNFSYAERAYALELWIFPYGKAAGFSCGAYSPVSPQIDKSAAIAE